MFTRDQFAVTPPALAGSAIWHFEQQAAHQLAVELAGERKVLRHLAHVRAPSVVAADRDADKSVLALVPLERLVWLHPRRKPVSVLQDPSIYKGESSRALDVGDPELWVAARLGRPLSEPVRGARALCHLQVGGWKVDAGGRSGVGAGGAEHPAEVNVAALAL